MSHISPLLSASLTIRLAGPADDAAIERLAALDSRPRPAAPVLLAEVDGTAWAALSVASGLAVADPFEPSAEAVRMLRHRAGQLRPDTSYRLARTRRVARRRRLAV